MNEWECQMGFGCQESRRSMPNDRNEMQRLRLLENGGTRSIQKGDWSK